MALIDVHFKWSDEHGTCHDCGRPAAYEAIDAYGPGRHEKLCSVCTASWAADGHIDFRWLFGEEED